VIHNAHNYFEISPKLTENSSINVDNVDKWTTDFQELAYNICGIYTTNIQSLAYMVFYIIRIIHNLDLLRVCRHFA
jgi:hypothetical protein